MDVIACTHHLGRSSSMSTTRSLYQISAAGGHGTAPSGAARWKASTGNPCSRCCGVTMMHAGCASLTGLDREIFECVGGPCNQPHTAFPCRVSTWCAPDSGTTMPGFDAWSAHPHFQLPVVARDVIADVGLAAAAVVADQHRSFGCVRVEVLLQHRHLLVNTATLSANPVSVAYLTDPVLRTTWSGAPRCTECSANRGGGGQKDRSGNLVGRKHGAFVVVLAA